MLFLRKIFIYLLSLANLIFFYLLLIRPEKNFYWLALLFLSLFLLSRLAISKKIALKTFLLFFFFILIFLISNILFLSVLENIILSYLFIFFLALFLFFYFYFLYTYVYLPQEYQAFGLVKYISYLSFWNLISFAVFSYVIVSVLNFSIWLTALIDAVFFVIIMTYNFSLENFNFKKYWRYFIVYFCLIAEIGWLIAWLPWNYYVKGFTLAGLGYFILFYFIKRIKQDWSQKNFLWNLGVTGLLMIIILSTTRWF